MTRQRLNFRYTVRQYRRALKVALLMLGTLIKFAFLLIFVVSAGYTIFDILTSETPNTPVLIASILTGVFNLVQGVDYVRDRLVPDRKHAPPPHPQGTQTADQMINDYLDGRLRKFTAEENRFVPLSGETRIDTQYSAENQTFDDIQQATTHFDGRFALIGDPGAGKSTTLKDLMRHAIRAYKVDPAQARLPLWIDLGLSTNPPDARELIAYWWGDQAYLPNKFEQYLKQHNLALFLDGLNEMPDQGGANSRTARAESLKQFIADNPQLPVIVTCRVSDYQAKSRPNEHPLLSREMDKTKLDLALPVIVAHELDLPRIREMIAKSGADEGLLQKIEASEPNASLRRMAANPYNLTMLITVYKENKQIPADFNELYKKYVDAAYKHNKARKTEYGKLTELVRLEWRELEHGLKRLAYLMIIEGKGTSAEYVWAQKHIGKRALRDGINLGVLVETGASIRFYHQSLQGYFGVEMLSRALKRRKRGKWDVFTPDPVNLIQQIADLGEGGAPAVDALAELIKDESLLVRNSIVKAFKNIGDPRAVEPLITALQDNNEYVRESSAEALGNIGNLHAIEPLIVTLQDKDWAVRYAAAEALGKIGDARAVEPLIIALQDRDKDVRETSAEALGNIGDARAVEPLIIALQDRDKDVRVHAAKALGTINDLPVIEHLITTLQDKDHTIRFYAAEALGNIGDARAVEPLMSALQDKNNWDRDNIAEALGKLGDPRAIAPLIAALQDEDWLIHDNVAEALRKFDTPEVRQALKRAGY